MQTLAQIRLLLEERGLNPKKSLGQNFLIDKNLIQKLIETAELKPGQLVVEIGPGTGALTEALLEGGYRVVACELDGGLSMLLEERMPALGFGDRFRLIQGDALASSRALAPSLIEAIGSEPYSLVANLPYGPATPIMLSLLIDHPRCAALAVTIQKEVGDRLLAKPGGKEYGQLGIIAQAMAEISLIAKLPPECFWPRPKIDSVMVLLKRRATAMTDDPKKLAGVCQMLFSKRRKQIGSILGREVEMPAGIDASWRPEQLTVAQLIALSERVSLPRAEVS